MRLTGLTGLSGLTGVGVDCQDPEAPAASVMADAEGNEFCVMTEGSFELDDKGRADYLPRAL